MMLVLMIIAGALGWLLASWDFDRLQRERNAPRVEAPMFANDGWGLMGEELVWGSVLLAVIVFVFTVAALVRPA